MSGDGRIQLGVPLRTPLEEIVNEVVRQAVELCRGNQARAARALDIGGPQVRRRMNDLARSETKTTPSQGAGGAAIPSPGGREEMQDSGVRSQEPGSGDRGTDG